MIDILIIDDHHLVGQGTKTMLDDIEDYRVQYVSDASEALKLQVLFDIYIIDVHMPEMSGIELTEKLLGKNENLKIILYTGFPFQEYLDLYLNIGVSGVISKTSTKAELVNLINTILSGQTIVPLSIFKKAYRTNAKIKGLTPKEIKILQYISEGLSNKEIAGNLFVSDRTIEYHLTKIYKKLDVRTRAKAVKKAIKLSLLEL